MENISIFENGIPNFDVLGVYSLPDGYFGERKNGYALFCRDNGLIYHVFNSGYHKGGFLPMAFVDANEAAWHIENHPNGKKYYHSATCANVCHHCGNSNLPYCIKWDCPQR